MRVSFIPIILSILFMTGCSSLVLQPGDFAWPVENVLTVDSHGNIHIDRYSFSINVKPLLYEETQDSVNIAKKSLRMIRDGMGFYYITASGFKNIYVFEQSEGALKLRKKIHVAENGLNDPAFNQRNPYIQLVNGQTPALLLTSDGIIEGEKK